MPFTDAVSRYQIYAILLVLLGMVAVILTVLGFQHLGGYVPCK